ncbi:hypothetical protein CEXT_448831 [Caerostris extrusa]|uniref:Uncharacterized protein n=1 Tax=Caerostris extrusa TaxID=172846 RepID=A0AAV4PLS0_CAEEX|nr:hypothetical protein CEXT_448831 [Caerostris extrusa]
MKIRYYTTSANARNNLCQRRKRTKKNSPILQYNRFSSSKIMEIHSDAPVVLLAPEFPPLLEILIFPVSARRSANELWKTS